MNEDFHPYLIFLPTKGKRKVLRGIFGSKVPIDILRFSIQQGISTKIYQKDLIGSMGYSNKTVIERLKELTSLGLLKEGMEKRESDGRTVWVKHYHLTDLGKWFALLLAQDEELSREEKVATIESLLRLYVRWLKELSEKLDIKKKILKEIFLDEMK